jgi:membrane-associated protease RseP (regulator of RpoE activity)
MDGDSGQDGLRQGMSSMLALESRLDESLARLSAETSGYLEAPTVIGELRSLVREQREALQAHLEGLGDTDVPPVEAAISAAFEAPSHTQPGEQEQGTLAALRAVATAFTETAFGYEVLHGVAHRFFHVPTADLADQHRRNYLQAAQAVHRAAGDVVIQVLQDAGHACRCECPACGPGICLCWHVHVEPDVQGPGLSGEGFVVRAPRAGSNAEQAGLRHGDVILAVDGQEVSSYQEMVGRMREHQPGERVELRARRGTGAPQELVVTR